MPTLHFLSSRFASLRFTTWVLLCVACTGNGPHAGTSADNQQPQGREVAKRETSPTRAEAPMQRVEYEGEESNRVLASQALPDRSPPWESHLDAEGRLPSDWCGPLFASANHRFEIHAPGNKSYRVLVHSKVDSVLLVSTASGCFWVDDSQGLDPVWDNAQGDENVAIAIFSHATNPQQEPADSSIRLRISPDPRATTESMVSDELNNRPENVSSAPHSLHVQSNRRC